MESTQRAGLTLTFVASAIVYLAPWSSETGSILAGLWTVLLAFWTLDRQQVTPYLHQAAVAVILVGSGLLA